MRHRCPASMSALVVAIISVSAPTIADAGQRSSRPPAAASTWTPPRTPDDRPDLQGIWDLRSATPLERPSRFAGKEFLTDAEAAEYERVAAGREDGRPPDDPRSDPSVHPPWWLDYGKKVVGTKRTSLVVDPPDGRVPPLTPEAQRRAADRRAARGGRGPADSYEDRSLFERCITRGLPVSMMPGPYNNNIHFLQTPGSVAILMEMIHETRIIPLDGRAHLPPAVRQWLGDPRGHWEGDTLVVETTNFTDKNVFRGSSAGLRLVERFTRVDGVTIDYAFTAHDPAAWPRPWTVAYPLVKTDGPLYEYACHEGNYGLEGIIRGARAEERAASGTAKKP